MSGSREDMSEWTQMIPRAFPGFADRFDAFLAESHGELLPTLMWGQFAEFTQDLLDPLLPGPADRYQTVKEIADFLEKAATSGRPDVENLVQVGFMEQLNEKGANSLMSILGPNSLALLKRSRTY
jgi:hypothetical protein